LGNPVGKARVIDSYWSHAPKPTPNVFWSYAWGVINIHAFIWVIMKVETPQAFLSCNLEQQKITMGWDKEFSMKCALSCMGFEEPCGILSYCFNQPHLDVDSLVFMVFFL
jgi:hypothetical protein